MLRTRSAIVQPQSSHLDALNGRSRAPWGRVVTYDPNRDPGRAYLADNLTPRRAATLLKSADSGDLGSLLELTEELQARDAHLLSVSSTRQAALTLLDWRIISAADKQKSVVDQVLANDAAHYCQEVLDEHEDAETVLGHLSDAIISGLAVAELEWNPQGRLIDLTPVDNSRLTADYRKDQQVRVRTQEEPVYGVVAEQGKFIVHMPQATTGYPTRKPLIRAALLIYLAKTYSFKDWLVFAEIFGMPVRAAKYDAATVTQDEKQEALDMLRLMGTDAVAVFSKALDLEIIETPNRQGAPYKDLIEFCNRQLSILILGQHLTTDTTGGTGTYAAAAVQENVRDDLRLQDRKDEAATLRRQLLAPMVRWGLGAQYPVPYFERIVDEPVDRKFEAEVLQIATQGVGMPVKKSEAYERLGYTVPSADDDVLERQEQPAGAAWPGFGG